MTIMGSLPDEVSLVLTLYEGSDFLPKSFDSKQSEESDIPAKLIAVASFPSIEEQVSNPLEFTTTTPSFNCEFEWVLNKKSFQAMRSRKIQLKVQFFVINSNLDENVSLNNETDKTCIGNVMFDLRETTPMFMEGNVNTSMPHETSYLAHAKWKTLVNAKSIPGRLAPSIKYAFILEPKSNLNNTDFTTDGDVAKPAMPSKNVASKDDKLQKSASQDLKVTEALNSDGQLAPVLMEKLGYFLLGDRKDANQTFYFNVFISSGKNLELAISEDNASLIGQGTTFYFSYNLFGCNIQTESFKNLHDTSSEFLAERASARVLTNSRTIEKFFKEVLSPLEIDLCSNDNVVAC